MSINWRATLFTSAAAVDGPVLICSAMEAERIMFVDGPPCSATIPRDLAAGAGNDVALGGQSGRVTTAPENYRAYGPQKLLPPQALLERMVLRGRLPPESFREMGV